MLKCRNHEPLVTGMLEEEKNEGWGNYEIFRSIAKFFSQETSLKIRSKLFETIPVNLILELAKEIHTKNHNLV